MLLNEVSAMNPVLQAMINFIKSHNLKQRKNPATNNYTFTGDPSADFDGYDFLGPDEKAEFDELYKDRYAKEQQDAAAREKFRGEPGSHGRYPESRPGKRYMGD